MSSMFNKIISVAVLSVAANVNAGVIVGGSSMLDANDGTLTQLESWLGQGELTLTNIFTKNHQDGRAGNDTSYDWHNAVDGKGATFTLWEVRTSNGTGGYDDFIFGGYNDESWSSNVLHGSYDFEHNDLDRNNFIFNLTTGVKLEQCLSTDYDCGANNYDGGAAATYNRSTHGATFGSGHDLYVNTSLSGGYNYSHSYGINDPTQFEIHQATRSQLDNDHNSYNWISVGAYETFTIAGYTPPPTKVSEPGSLALLGLGLAGLGFARRKSKA